jgi:hypothetical protein
VTMASLPSDVRPIKQPWVEDELLADGGMILYNGKRNEVLTVNGTGALVWECCDGAHDVDAIVSEIRDVFPGAEEIERDVRDLVHQLWQAGMIAPGP